jgi:hypothetical protein
MDAPGDISDEFDDETLKTSIEKADQTGEWRDAAEGFVDPKLETIKKQLAEPERANYSQRRLRELQQQAAAKAAADAAAAAAQPPPAKEGDPFSGDWRETVVPSAAIGSGAPATVTAIADPAYLVSGRSVHPVLSHLQPVLSGLWVFVPIGVVQALLAGWHYEILLRTLFASALAGVLWHKLDVERFRAAVVGVAVHLLAFFVTASAWDAYSLIGNATGFVIAMIGSLVMGSLRESRKLLTDRSR